MPNYKYVATSKFEPFTFDEMLKPALLAQAKHDEIEKAYGELGENAEELRSRINEINDPTSYARYKEYENAFDENYQSFSKHGLDHKSNKTLMDVKRYYKNRVKPIENSWMTRKEQQDYIRKLVDANPTLLIQNDILSPGSGSSLDRWLEDSNYSYGKTYSGAMITKQVAEALAPIAKSLTSYGKGVQIDDDTNTFVKQFGYTPRKAYEAMQAYLANPNAPNDFVSKVINSVIDSSGIRSWADEETLSRAYNYGAQAIPAVIGTGDVSPIENYAARHNSSNLNFGGNNEKQYFIKPQSIITKSDMKDYINNHKYRKYFDVDDEGNLMLNQAGMKEYQRVVDASRGGNAEQKTKAGGYLRNDFRDFVENELGVKLNVTRAQKGSVGTGYYMPDATRLKIGSKFTDYINQQSGRTDPNFYDTYQTTKYQLEYKESDGKEILNTLLNASPDGLDVVKFNNKNGQPKYSKKDFLSGKDLKGAYVTSTNSSIYGNTATVRLSNGEPVEVLIPKGINEGVEDNISKLVNYITVLGAKYHELNESDSNSNEMIAIDNETNRALAQLEESQHSLFGFKSYKSGDAPITDTYVNQPNDNWYELYLKKQSNQNP